MVLLRVARGDSGERTVDRRLFVVDAQ